MLNFLTRCLPDCLRRFFTTESAAQAAQYIVRPTNHGTWRIWDRKDPGRYAPFWSRGEAMIVADVLNRGHDTEDWIWSRI